MNPKSSEIWPEARGCVTYTSENGVLSDCLSPVAVAAWRTDQMGVAQLFSKGSDVGTEEPLLSPLCRLFVDLGSGWEPVPVTDRSEWPGGWEEMGETSAVRVRQQVWFAANDRLVVEWTFLNAPEEGIRVAVLGGASPCPARIQAHASGGGWTTRLTSPRPGLDGLPEYHMDLVARSVPAPVFVGFDSGEQIPSLPPKHETLVAALTEGQTGAYWAEWTDTRKLRMDWSWTYNSQAPEPTTEAQREQFEEALEWWKERLEALPLTDPDQRQWRRKLWQTCVRTC